MVKKLWFSTRIGKEPLIDQLFHFHQVRVPETKDNRPTDRRNLSTIDKDIELLIRLKTDWRP